MPSKRLENTLSKSIKAVISYTGSQGLLGPHIDVQDHQYNTQTFRQDEIADFLNKAADKANGGKNRTISQEIEKAILEDFKDVIQEKEGTFFYIGPVLEAFSNTFSSREVDPFTRRRTTRQQAERINTDPYLPSNIVQKPYTPTPQPSKKLNTDISTLKEIRIIVNKGRGFGHQRAAITLMEKIREIGFCGIFDLRYAEFHAKPYMTKEQAKAAGFVGRRLKDLIPGFVPLPLDSSEKTQEISHPKLGQLKVTRLPELSINQERYNLPAVSLTLTAADDQSHIETEKLAQKFSSEVYIDLEPTDWDRNPSFIITSDGIKKNLPEKMRLSSSQSYQLSPIENLKTSVAESRTLELAKDQSFNSQLVYSLYPAYKKDPLTNKNEKTGDLDPITLCSRLIEAHINTQKQTNKPSILFIPQEIGKDPNFQSALNERFPSIQWIDLTEEYSSVNKISSSIVIAHTGTLQKDVFDHLLLKGTTFPPVIEGCNARELCESAGRPFIHGSAMHEPLIKYNVPQSMQSYQALHSNASLCLEKGAEDQVASLSRYMLESQNPDSPIHAYHIKRREEFLGRPDACEVAFGEIGISYTKQSTTESQKSPSAQESNKEKTSHLPSDHQLRTPSTITRQEKNGARKNGDCRIV